MTMKGQNDHVTLHYLRMWNIIRLKSK